MSDSIKIMDGVLTKLSFMARIITLESVNDCPHSRIQDWRRKIL